MKPPTHHNATIIVPASSVYFLRADGSRHPFGEPEDDDDDDDATPVYVPVPHRDDRGRKGAGR